MKTYLHIASTFLLLLTLSLLAGCGDSKPTSSTPSERVSIRLALNWYPEAEHGGFYEALVKGYYKEEGLDVEIVPGGPNAPVCKRVAKGSIEFGVANADDVLNARADAMPIIALMAPIQKSPRCIMVHKDSSIKSLKDLKDITLAMSNRPAYSHWVKKNYPLENVKVVPYSGSVIPFLKNKNYAQQGYIISEPFVAEKNGAPTRSLLVADAGFNPYVSLLVTSEEILKNKKDLVAKVVRASLKGWETYMEDPKQTHEHIHQLNEAMSIDILNYGQKELESLVYNPDAYKHGLGIMTTARWNRLHNQMIEIGQYDKEKVKPNEAYTTEFLNP